MQISDEYFSSKVHPFDDLCHVFGGGEIGTFPTVVPESKTDKIPKPHIFLGGLWTLSKSSKGTLMEIWDFGIFSVLGSGTKVGKMP